MYTSRIKYKQTKTRKDVKGIPIATPQRLYHDLSRGHVVAQERPREKANDAKEVGPFLPHVSIRPVTTP
jgi:hypothetical protein